MTKQGKLIDSLATDLKPVRPVGGTDGRALLWLMLSALYVAAITQVFGPLRPNALDQLLSEPRFALETALGAVAIIWLGLEAFRAALPGALSRRFALIGTALMLFWWANYFVGLVSPSLEPSMLGKRDHCFIETAVYAIPPLLLGFFLMRRLYPLQPVRNSVMIGFAAGMIPALYMQLACMYAPMHIILFHLLPGAFVAVLAALLAAVVYRR